MSNAKHDHLKPIHGEPEEDEDEDDWIEQFIKKGECVYAHDWDSGGPGAGAGCEQVLCWQGRFVMYSLDFDTLGPFDTFEEAMRSQNLRWVSSATTEIFCSLLPAERVAEMLINGDGVPEVYINGELCVYHSKSGQYRRAGADQ